jgi:lysophospholipase L1-like esterase
VWNPFWKSRTIDAEPVLFVPSADGSATARLLFRPETVLRVTNSAGDIVYREGSDYVVDCTQGQIIRPVGSHIPTVAVDDVALANGSLTHEQAATVTYTHASQWAGIVPHFVADQLAETVRRLRERQRVTIALSGDSIGEGYDSSGFHGVPPNQAAFGELVARRLEEHYRTEIRFQNLAVAGWTAADGLDNVDQLLAVAPDLVIVAFGMNDAAYAEADEFAEHIKGFVRSVRESYRAAEFVLVAPMRPTPACTWVVPARFDAYREALAALTGVGIALADLTALWTDILRRKSPYDLSGNGLNHPNDFGHRVYADAISSLLVDDAG